MLQHSDYLKIGKRGETCAACGRSLAEESRHPSVLMEPTEAQAVPEGEAADTPVAKAAGGAAMKDGDGVSQAAEADDFRRLDYCDACWREIKEGAYFSFWIGKRQVENQPRRKLNRVERNLALAALFDSLSDRRGEADADFAPHLFFLAHLLMKYKIFKWKPGSTDAETGGRLLHFDRTDCDDSVTLADIEMPPEMVVKVKEEVEAYLQESTGQEVHL